MYSASYEEIYVIENIGVKPKTVSEKIKEAIIEMNIMRNERVSRESLMKLIEEYN